MRSAGSAASMASSHGRCERLCSVHSRSASAARTRASACRAGRSLRPAARTASRPSVRARVAVQRHRGLGAALQLAGVDVDADDLPGEARRRAAVEPVDLRELGAGQHGDVGAADELLDRREGQRRAEAERVRGGQHALRVAGERDRRAEPLGEGGRPAARRRPRRRRAAAPGARPRRAAPPRAPARRPAARAPRRPRRRPGAAAAPASRPSTSTGTARCAGRGRPACIEAHARRSAPTASAGSVEISEKPVIEATSSAWSGTSCSGPRPAPEQRALGRAGEDQQRHGVVEGLRRSGSSRWSRPAR